MMEPIKEESHANPNVKESDGLRRENDFLKDYVIRLSKELQRKSQNHSSNYKHLDPAISLSSDVVDGQVCIPLFHAYDSRIEELCIFLDQQGSALDNLTSLVKNLSEENQQLRTSCSDSTKIIEKSASDKEKIGGDIEILEQQAELLAVELKQANQTVSMRDKCIAELSNEISSKLECIRGLTKRNKELSNEKSEVEQKLLDVIETLEISKQKGYDLETKLKTLHDLQHEMESKAIIAGETESDVKSKNYILHEKLVKVSLTIQHLQQQLCDTTKSYEKLNLESMDQSKLLTDMKNTISILKHQANEKDVRLRFAEENHTRAKTKLTETSALMETLVLEKDQLSAKAQALEKQLCDIFESRRLPSDICSIFETIQRLHDQHQKSIESQDNLIESLKTQMSNFQFELDLRNKSLNDATIEKQELDNLITTERSSRSDPNVISQSLRLSNERLEAERLKLKSALVEIGFLKSTVSSLQDSLDTIKLDYVKLQKESAMAKNIFQAERSEIQVLLEESKIKSQAERITFQEERDSNNETIRRLNVTYQTELSAVRERLKQQDQTFKENQEMMETYQKEILSLSQKIQDEQARILQLGESNILELNQIHQDDMKRLDALQSKNLSLSKEKKELTECLQGAIMCNKTLECTTKDLEMRLSIMGNQLSNCLGQHKTRLEKERGLRLELQSLKKGVHLKVTQ